MFEVFTRIEYKNVKKCYKDLAIIGDNIPIVLVGNKVNQKDIKVKARQIILNGKRNLYIWIFQKSRTINKKPFHEFRDP